MRKQSGEITQTWRRDETNTFFLLSGDGSSSLPAIDVEELQDVSEAKVLQKRKEWLGDVHFRTSPFVLT